MNMIASIKTAVVDHWKGQYELEALDDLLPCLIYVVAMSRSQTLFSQINFMFDYAKSQSKFENELLQITNLDAAVKFIVMWKPEGA